MISSPKCGRCKKTTALLVELALCRPCQKALSREADEEALRNGTKTPELLNKENGVFSGLKFRILWDKVKKLS